MHPCYCIVNSETDLSAVTVHNNVPRVNLYNLTRAPQVIGWIRLKSDPKCPHVYKWQHTFHCITRNLVVCVRGEYVVAILGRVIVEQSVNHTVFLEQWKNQGWGYGHNSRSNELSAHLTKTKAAVRDETEGVLLLQNKIGENKRGYEWRSSLAGCKWF